MTMTRRMWRNHLWKRESPDSWECSLDHIKLKTTEKHTCYQLTYFCTYLSHILMLPLVRVVLTYLVS